MVQLLRQWSWSTAGNSGWTWQLPHEIACIKKSTEKSQRPLIRRHWQRLNIFCQCCWRMSERNWTLSWSLCCWDRPLNRVVPCVSAWETPPLNMLQTFASTSLPSYAAHTTCLRPPLRYCSGKQPQALFFVSLSSFASLCRRHFIINIQNTVTLILKQYTFCCIQWWHFLNAILLCHQFHWSAYYSLTRGIGKQGC